MDKKKTGLIRYVGEGAFLPGVPARDMKIAEWEALPESVRQVGLDCGLYLLPEDQAGSDQKEE